MWCLRLAHGEFHWATDRDGLMVPTLEAWASLDPEAAEQFIDPQRAERESLQREFMKVTGLDIRDRVHKQAREQ